MNRPENTLVELFIVHNKADAALAARLRDEETRAAPSRGSRNLSDDVLLRRELIYFGRLLIFYIGVNSD